MAQPMAEKIATISAKSGVTVRINLSQISGAIQFRGARVSMSSLDFSLRSK
jgi:hypothetical protein